MLDFRCVLFKYIFTVFHSLNEKLMSRNTLCICSYCLILKGLQALKMISRLGVTMSRKLNPGMFQSRTVTGKTSANSNDLLHQSSYFYCQ